MASPSHREYMAACGLTCVGQQLKLEAEVKKMKELLATMLSATPDAVVHVHKLPSVKARKQLLTPAQDRIFRIK